MSTYSRIYPYMSIYTHIKALLGNIKAFLQNIKAFLQNIKVFLQNIKALLQNIRAFLKKIKAFGHLADDGTLHLYINLKSGKSTLRICLVTFCQQNQVFRRKHEMIPRTIGTFP